MMDMAPRNLPVYQKLEIELPKRIASKDLVGLSLEQSSAAEDKNALPEFNSWTNQKHFLDFFLKQKGEVKWKLEVPQDWILVSAEEGKLSSQAGNLEERIWVSIDWDKIKSSVGEIEGEIVVHAGNQDFKVKVKGEKRPAPPQGIEHLEGNHYLVINAEDYSNAQGLDSKKWDPIAGLGHSGSVMRSVPLKDASIPENEITQNSAHLAYDFYLHHGSDEAEILLTALPTHPLTDQNELRIAVSLDNGPVMMLDFETHGRSAEWKQNVLANKTTKSIKVGSLEEGKHNLKVFWVDPGVLLDYVYIDLGGNKFPYGKLPATQISQLIIEK